MSSADNYSEVGDTLILHSRYPCCPHVRCRFKVLVGFPREGYDRKCPNCGQKWDVMRMTLRERGRQMRIDKLEWERR